MPPAQSKPNFVRHAPGSLSGGFRLRKNQICCHMLDPTQPGKHATSQAMAYFGDQQQLSTLVLNYGDWQTNKKSGGHIPLCQIQKSEKKGELSGKNPLAKDPDTFFGLQKNFGYQLLPADIWH